MSFALFFLSGNQGIGEFRDGNADHRGNPGVISRLLILRRLHGCDYWPPRCNANGRQEAVMIHRTFFLHYRLVLGAVTTAATIGAALLLSYLVLWARL